MPKYMTVADYIAAQHDDQINGWTPATVTDTQATIDLVAGGIYVMEAAADLYAVEGATHAAAEAADATTGTLIRASSTFKDRYVLCTLTGFVAFKKAVAGSTTLRYKQIGTRTTV